MYAKTENLSIVFFFSFSPGELRPNYTPVTSSEICKVHDAIFLVARKISNEKRSGTIGHAYLQGPWSFHGDHLAMQDALTSG